MSTTTQNRTSAGSTRRTDQPASQLILVQVRMDHVTTYQREPFMTLLYRCTFPVVVGTTVLVPPTRLHPLWQRGTVVRVGVDRDGYTGRIKPVSPLGRRHWS